MEYLRLQISTEILRKTYVVLTECKSNEIPADIINNGLFKHLKVSFKVKLLVS
jgi:hypothetical protein